jgi:sugar phosphate isomerase/epimerase
LTAHGDLVTVLLGNAAAPRWYDRSLDRLPSYVSHVKRHGATATEIVLHQGEADDVTSRVHVLAEDAAYVATSYQAADFQVHLHAPLTSEHRIARWADDPQDFRDRFRPILALAGEIAANQPGRTILVLHAPSGTTDDAAILSKFLDWASANSFGLSFSVELRHATDRTDERFDRRRESLLRFVDRVDSDGIGICWDLGHDWENREFDPAWSVGPGDEFMARVSHVHLHGAAQDRTVHHPLQVSVAPWREMLASLLEAGYNGAITMEIRYRYALALGEPWDVLAGSYALALETLRSAFVIDKSLVH